MGHCGRNAEYLQKLVDFIHSDVPKTDICNDQYILDLWDLVKEFSHNYESRKDVNASNERMNLILAYSISSSF